MLVQDTSDGQQLGGDTGGDTVIGDPEHFRQDGAAAFLCPIILHFIPTKSIHSLL